MDAAGGTSRVNNSAVRVSVLATGTKHSGASIDRVRWTPHGAWEQLGPENAEIVTSFLHFFWCNDCVI